MPTKRRNWWLILVVLTAVAVACTVLGACDGRPLQPRPCATWQAEDGTWMEEDDEPVDADPCDREPDHGEVKPSKKKPATTPVKKSSGRKFG